MNTKKTIGATLALLATLLAASGCATQFTGEAHVPGGPAGCDAKCKSWGLEFVGMIAMGEYSDACVCKRPEAQASLLDPAGSAAAASGVVMQMRRAAASSSAAAAR